MISINRKWTQNLNYELNYWWHLYFLFWIFIFVLLYSGMQEAKLYYSGIDKTNRWIYRFIFEFKHLNWIFFWFYKRHWYLNFVCELKSQFTNQLLVWSSTKVFRHRRWFFLEIYLPTFIYLFCKILSLDLWKIGRI